MVQMLFWAQMKGLYNVHTEKLTENPQNSHLIYGQHIVKMAPDSVSYQITQDTKKLEHKIIHKFDQVIFDRTQRFFEKLS